MCWTAYENGQTIGCSGSENGVIMADEEYAGSARITLEKCERYHAITCGIYGAMMHTAFCNETECFEKYEAMKTELKNFLCADNSENDEQIFYDTFINKF